MELASVEQAAAVRSNPAVVRVEAALRAAGIDAPIIVHAVATPTSQSAADVLGCNVAQIAKSVIFRAKQTDEVVLVIASGANRVDEKKVKALVRQGIAKADADFVKAKTGFSIGGVSPLGHLSPPIVLFDESLLAYPLVYPAAGHPNTGFGVEPAALAKAAGARVVDVRQ
jgi:prolyl-tRNA editing enzyme YbaK/EbsC (Cys-tRNA(Pro) deacylase)